MPSKKQRKEIKAKHQKQRYRVKYKRITNKYAGGRFGEYSIESFNNMIAELLRLNTKYLQQLLSDLRDGYIPPWSGDYHRMLQHAVELNILERTVLK